MHYLILASLFFATIDCFAQKVVDVTKVESIGPGTFYSVGGEPFVNAKFVRLQSGTPYFEDQWMKGRGLTRDGKGYSTSAVRLNLLDNQIVFLDARGTELIATVPLIQLTLTDTILAKEYHFFHSSAFPDSLKVNPGWYQQLVSGEADLLVYYSKQLNENKPYGSATAEQVIDTKEQYFIYTNNGLQQVKKIKDVPAVLKDKRTELETYLKKSGAQYLSLKAQLTDVISYYNSLN